MREFEPGRRPGLTGTGRFPSAGVAPGVAAGVIAAIRPARGGPARLPVLLAIAAE